MSAADHAADAPEDLNFDEEATLASLGSATREAYAQDLRQELEREAQQDVELPPSHYELLGEIGAGAMGAILRAKDRSLRRLVAYKKILPEFIEQRESLSRFLREMQITAQLEHPHIVPVYEFEFTADGSMAYTMKLIRGRTLKDLIQEGRKLLEAKRPLSDELSRNRLLEHFLAVCDAMYYAHSKGVIHRDLKPANLMIGAYGEVYVMDWGIARQIGRFQTPEQADSEADATGLTQVQDEDFSLDETRAGQILGTPRYMSPQQAAGKNKALDGRSDQFSLGLILFEILTHKPAFKVRNTVDLLKKILKVEVEPFEALGGEAIPRELKAIIRKALARKPEARYETVAELARDLRRYLRGEAVLAEPDRGLQRAQRWISQHRQQALSLLMGLLLVSATGVSVSVYNQQRAMARARVVEQHMNTVIGAISQRAQRIDSHFLKMEGLLRYLAAAAQEYLEQAPPAQEAYYPQHPFTAPDQVDSPLFGTQISLDWPTSGFSPHKTMADMHGKLQRLLPLRHIMKEVMLRSATEHPEQLSAAQIEQMIAHKGTPIMWAHVSLEEGVIYMLPGIDFNTPGYDARTRPFYKLSAHKYGVHWGSPYFDPLSGALLPATTALYDPQGQFLGVAGIDLRFQYVIDELMTLKDQPELAQTYLLNDKAEIMIRSTEAHKTQSKRNLTQGFQTPVFDQSELVQAILKGQRGGYVLSRDDQGQPRLLFYARLNTLGWYFVAEVHQKPEAL